jgi:hypothetical protein
VSKIGTSEIACTIPLETSNKKQLIPARESIFVVTHAFCFIPDRRLAMHCSILNYTKRMLGPFVFLRDPFLIETGRAHPENPADAPRHPHFVHSCVLSNDAGRYFAFIILYEPPLETRGC